jgi:eukaryotic-like serine/threonine-protein kinase
MSANAEDPLLSAAARICDGMPVDWRRVRELLANPALETIAHELESIEHFARASSEAPPAWGRFRIVEELGRGVFGTVYRAVDSTLQIEVALKIVRPRPGVPFNYERALQEARRLARVSHLGVVRVFAVERIGDEVGLSMELVQGKTLDAIVRDQGRFSASEASIIGMDLCRALAAVHGAGLLHGDIKAHNVMRAVGGRTVLMDFGAGRELSIEPVAPGSDFAGTPIYLAPEVFAGANRTPSSDIYSLGVLLYFLVAGSYPVDGGTRSEIGRFHDQRGSRRPLRDVRPDLPDGFIRVVERALADDPRQRFESAGSLEAALAAPASPIVAPSPGPDGISAGRLVAMAAAIVTVVGLAAVLAVIDWNPPGSGARDAAPPTAAATPNPALAVTPGDEYLIDASFYKERDHKEEPLAPGDRVRPRDRLSFQVQVSVPTYLYVVNEDDEGASFLMFPLPGQSVVNPLQPGRRHRIPGFSQGELLSWEVSTPGRREHFLLFASRERSPEFETIVSTLPVPLLNKPVEPAPLSPDALSVLRSVGGLAVSSVPPGSDGKSSRQLHRLPEFAPFVPGEKTARGIWRRRATFENPSEGGAKSRQLKK